MIDTSQFPFHEAKGNNYEIGFSLGQKFSAEIKETYRIYYELFEKLAQSDGKQPTQNVRVFSEKLADYFASQVSQHLPHLHDEICAYANGSGLTIQQLYILNARTEIFHIIKNNNPASFANLEDLLAECTSLYSGSNNVLAQNWDWMPELEDLCMVLKLTAPGKPQIITFTEPGILSKIGINSEGLAVCLNILFSNVKIKGIPTHILLRAILECADTAKALELISRLPISTSSNIMIADKHGQAVNLEINGSEIIHINPDNQFIFHTNHYLDKENEVNSTVPGSVERLNRAKQVVENQTEFSVNQIKSILADEQGTFPICRAYAQGAYFLVGTVAATIADLNNNTLSICKGQPRLNADWTTYSFK